MPPGLVTYNDVQGADQVKGRLFAGKKFWLAQRTPLRGSFVKDIEANGGEVVKLEKQADYLIADHARTDSPAGSLSYKFIERAIADGSIPPEDQFAAGRPKGTPRPVGSAIPSKTTRTPFTQADDIELWQWVKEAEANGIAIKGNEIYKQLEAMNPRHTYQSWRDRYIKILAFKPPLDVPTSPAASHVTPGTPGQVAKKVDIGRPEAANTTVRSAPVQSRNKKSPVANQRKTPMPRRTLGTAEALSAPPQSEPVVEPQIHPAQETQPVHITEDPHDNLAQSEHEPAVDEQVEPTTMPGFETEDFDDWLKGAETIQEIAVGRYHRAWVAMADANPEHTAAEWRAYYEQVILPVFLANEENDIPMPGAIGNRRFRNIMKAFGTQGQPVHTPSRRRSVAVTTAQRLDQPTSANPKDNSTHLPAIVEDSPKRKLAKLEPASEKAEKRRKIDETVNLGTLVQSDLNSPQLPELPLAGQSSHISISSNHSSNKGDEPRAFDVDRTTPTSDMDALVQTQLLGEMELQQTERKALTAENLALAQAEHNPRRDNRALDIAPDDEDQDQGAYAGYLENLMQNAASNGRINKDSLEALKSKHQHLDALAKEHDNDGDSVDDDKNVGLDLGGEDDDDDNDVGENVNSDDIADNDSSIYIAPDGRRIDMKNIPIMIQTQDIDPNLDYSSPLRPQSPDYPAPLDPDHTPRQSPYKTQTQNGDLEYLDEEEDIDDIQLDLPDPPGGWESRSSQGSKAHNHTVIDNAPRPAPRDKGNGRARELYTQDIFSAETQEPDFDIPDPASSQPDTQKHLPEPVIESQVMEGEDTQAFVEQQVELGHEEQDVYTALFQTSMRPELCVDVLEETRQGRGVPTNVAGIWPESEDQIIEGGDAVKIRQLHEKHGSAECNARLQFLRDWREQQEEGEEEESQ